MCCGKASKQHTISSKLLSWSFVIVSGEVHWIYRTNPTQIYGLRGNRPTPSKTHCSTTKEKRQRTKCAGQDKKYELNKVPWDIALVLVMFNQCLKEMKDEMGEKKEGRV